MTNADLLRVLEKLGYKFNSKNFSDGSAFFELEFTEGDLDLKFKLLCWVNERLNVARIYVPIMKKINKDMYQKAINYICDQNLQMVYGSIALRPYEEEYLFEYSHGICLVRGKDGILYEEEIAEIFNYICYIVFTTINDFWSETEREIKDEQKGNDL